MREGEREYCRLQSSVKEKKQTLERRRERERERKRVFLFKKIRKPLHLLRKATNSKSSKIPNLTSKLKDKYFYTFIFGKLREENSILLFFHI